jgi:hypothetical protein
VGFRHVGGFVYPLVPPGTVAATDLFHELRNRYRLRPGITREEVPDRVHGAGRDIFKTMPRGFAKILDAIEQPTEEPHR